MLEDGTEFHMLAERKYPLTKETLEKMLVLRLIVESESEAAFDLLRNLMIDKGKQHRSLYTPQQNKELAERSNRKLIEAARTMLADSKLPTTFWAEVVNTACYVQNRVLVVKPHNKTPYELLHGRTPTLSFMRPFGCPITILNTIDHLGKFDGKADEGFFVGYSLNSKAFRVFNSRTRIVEKNLHIRFSENTPNVVVEPKKVIQALKDPSWIEAMQEELLQFKLQEVWTLVDLPNRKKMSSMGELTFFLGLKVKQKKDGIFISQDKYVGEILKKFRFTEVKTASTPIETQKPLLKDEDGEEVDVHMYRSMIGSLMYLTSSRPDIMFAVCACARYQVNPKVSHLHAVKRIFRYLKGQPKLGLWYPKDSPFDLVAYTDSDYAGASLDRKSTTGGCQFLGCRLISWQCKKQTVVANSTTEAEYVAASSCCGQIDDGKAVWNGIGVNAGDSKLMLLGIKLTTAGES
ncbi:uncharacterized mitochondrial protein-like protein [Tanacetum coccineum]